MSALSEKTVQPPIRAPDAEHTSVLVVDDSPLQLKAMEKMLTSLGFEVEVASSGIEALKKLRSSSKKPQLVVADVEMPKMRGPELLVEVRGDPTLEGIPVILMSAVDTSPESVESAYGQGGQDYLFKPIGKRTLQKKIADVTESARVRQDAQTYASRFEQEKAEVEKLRKQLNDVTQASVASSIATPLRSASSKLQQLIDEGNLDADSKELLRQVHATLSQTSNLHKPEFARLVNSTQFKEVFSEVTSSWLSQYIENTENEADVVVRDKQETHGSSNEADALAKWDYNCVNDSVSDMLDNIVRMYRYFDLFQKFKIDRGTFGVFLANLQKSYHGNPYHNFRHAFDVTQTTFSLLVEFNAQRYLTDMDVLGLLTAAVCHDADHPGNNNAFQIATRSPLATVYNDQSVLENHHCAVAFTIMKTVSGANIFASLSDDDYQQVRKIMIHCILSTDMAKHFTITTKFQTRFDSGKFPDVQNPEDRLDIMCLILKAADISNVVKKVETATWWNKNVAREFFGTGDELKSLGLPVAPHLDREKTSEANVTVSFIDFIAKGFFVSFVKLLDPAGQVLIKNIEENRQMLIDRTESKTSKKSKKKKK